MSIGSKPFVVPYNATLSGTLAIAVDPAGAGSSDILFAGQLLDLSVGSSAVDFSALGTLDDPAYVFASYGTLNGTFGSVSNLPSGYGIDYAYLGNSIALVTVPEPKTITLLGGAAVGLLLRRRRPCRGAERDRSSGM